MEPTAVVWHATTIRELVPGDVVVDLPTKDGPHVIHRSQHARGGDGMWALDYTAAHAKTVAVSVADVEAASFGIGAMLIDGAIEVHVERPANPTPVEPPSLTVANIDVYATLDNASVELAAIADELPAADAMPVAGASDGLRTPLEPLTAVWLESYAMQLCAVVDRLESRRLEHGALADAVGRIAAGLWRIAHHMKDTT